MATDRTDLQARRIAVRRRALANVILVLMAQSRRSAGRFLVEPSGRDAVLLHYRDVRTLIRHAGAYALATRDFTVLLALPLDWPFVRAASVRPVVLRPRDFAHPNASGDQICVDLAGVEPERLPEILFDNLTIRRRRLDHVVDPYAADYVREHLADRAADPRPLYPDMTGGEEGTR